MRQRVKRKFNLNFNEIKSELQVKDDSVVKREQNFDEFFTFFLVVIREKDLFSKLSEWVDRSLWADWVTGRNENMKRTMAEIKNEIRDSSSCITLAYEFPHLFHVRIFDVVKYFSGETFLSLPMIIITTTEHWTHLCSWACDKFQPNRNSDTFSVVKTCINHEVKRKATPNINKKANNLKSQSRLKSFWLGEKGKYQSCLS